MRSMARCRGRYSARYWLNCRSRPLSERCRNSSAQEIQIRHRLRHLKAHLLILQVRVAVSPRAPQPAQRLIVGQRQFAHFRRRRRQVVVVEELHLRLQILLLLVQAHDLEAPLPARQNIHPSVGIHLQHLLHHYRATGVQNARPL